MVARSFDNYGNESADSNEVIFFYDAFPPDNSSTPPQQDATEYDIVASLTPKLTLSTEARVQTAIKTQWQIFQTDDSGLERCLLNITSQTQLYTLQIPDYLLQQDTTYSWKAKHYYSDGTSSDWYTGKQIRPLLSETEWSDADGNGIPDLQDLDALIDGQLDLDKNGVPDIDQTNIKCFNADNGLTKIGFRIADEDAHKVLMDSIQVRSIPSSTLPSLIDSSQLLTAPFGLISFKLELENPGDTVEVFIYFSESISSEASWYKFSSETGWIPYENAYLNGTNSFSIILTDGGYGDDDGLANGVIIDPSGLFLPDDTSSSNESSPTPTNSSGGGGCFIGSVF